MTWQAEQLEFVALRHSLTSTSIDLWDWGRRESTMHHCLDSKKSFCARVDCWGRAMQMKDLNMCRLHEWYWETDDEPIQADLWRVVNCETAKSMGNPESALNIFKTRLNTAWVELLWRWEERKVERFIVAMSVLGAIFSATKLNEASKYSRLSGSWVP